MEIKKQNASIKEELQRTQEDVAALNKNDAWKSNPYVKAGMYVTGAVILVWTSQYVFAAFEGAIRQFKKLKKQLRNKDITYGRI